MKKTDNSADECRKWENATIGSQPLSNNKRHRLNDNTIGVLKGIMYCLPTGNNTAGKGDNYTETLDGSEMAMSHFQSGSAM